MPTKVLQQLDLPQCPLRQDLLTEYIRHLLYGHSFSCLVVCCCTAADYVSLGLRRTLCIAKRRRARIALVFIKTVEIGY